MFEQFEHWHNLSSISADSDTGSLFMQKAVNSAWKRSFCKWRVMLDSFLLLFLLVQAGSVNISAKQVISDCTFAGFCKLLLLLHIHSQTKVELGAFLIRFRNFSLLKHNLFFCLAD